jgi:hypothetical protein
MSRYGGSRDGGGPWWASWKATEMKDAQVGRKVCSLLGRCERMVRKEEEKGHFRGRDRKI